MHFMSRCHPFLCLAAICTILIHLQPTFGTLKTEPIAKSSLHTRLSQDCQVAKGNAPIAEQAIA
jgi:hypothetical protein